MICIAPSIINFNLLISRLSLGDLFSYDKYLHIYTLYVILFLNQHSRIFVLEITTHKFVTYCNENEFSKHYQGYQLQYNLNICVDELLNMMKID